MFEKNDYSYCLPPSLIAQYPQAQRSHSRLLHLPFGRHDFQEYRFRELVGLLHPGDLLVLNNTRVVKSRLFGRKETGGQVEVFVERILSTTDALCMVRASRSPAVGSRIVLDAGVTTKVMEKQGAFLRLCFQTGHSVADILAQQGSMPLPPYIERDSEGSDDERYQTVFSCNPGAVAAPTAGLHFDEGMLERLQHKGIQHVFITLHVGAGTFQPIRADDIREHRMHAERLEVDAAVCEAIQRTRTQGGRVIGVGSTAVRALESAASKGTVKPFSGETAMYITPGYRFQAVDAMITNFHLPESTLMVLVCAFGGYRRLMAAYQFAIDRKFRFYSYGDAMFIEKEQHNGI